MPLLKIFTSVIDPIPVEESVEYTIVELLCVYDKLSGTFER